MHTMAGNLEGAEALFSLLGAVEDPALFLPLGELGLLRGVEPLPEHEATTRTRRVRVQVAVPAPGYPESAAHELRDRMKAVLGDVELEVAFLPLSEEEAAEVGERLRQANGTDAPADPNSTGGIRPNPFGARRAGVRVLAICSGKGGVGKSSVTVNLAVALARMGQRVGVLDADIYGFSVPRMLGIDYPPLSVGRTLVPPVAHGVRVTSMGFFVDEDKAVAWRGPMLHKALEQFLVDVQWGPLDFLLVDMPPGTGDVPLSVADQLPGAECYVVTTPQPAAQRVAQRAAALAREVRLPVRGVIENMAYWRAPDGQCHAIFGEGGGAALAADLEVPLLASLPLESAVREGADEGVPAAVAAPEGEVAKAFAELAAHIVELGPARVYRSELKVH